MINQPSRTGNSKMRMPRLQWPKNLSFPAVIQKVKSEGVLTPLLWLCGLSFIATLVAAALSSPVMWVFAFISCASAFWVFRSFDYFRTVNPNLMQSEKLQIEMGRQQHAIASRIAEDAQYRDVQRGPNLHLEHAQMKDSTNG
ncbi:hypothetical protein [Methylobacterium soli]|uniref:Uncharacterized protein n=1 Tax=Methylobacterium soli TaxID=553447 RepID=A0A6L3T470_9HYPH|nr:hypothetical protein [Methylobacterium soli]KAB1081726.1 hypothetical protein F6X53_01095 [Methylobacterium soli]